MTLSRPLSSLLSSILLLAGLAAAAGPAAAQSTVVRLETIFGRIEMQLLDAQAPLTVANFLNYVRAGDYNDLFFSRSVRNFVVQGGGFRWPADGAITAVTKRASVTNEFSSARSNVRGTVALAKVANQPNSGSSEWFFNLVDNTTLNTQNGGFTVFARVTTEGMAVVDEIAKLQIVDASAVQTVVTDLPVVNYVPATNVKRDNVVIVKSITEFAPKSGVTDSDRNFDYLEKAFPQYLPPENMVTGTANGYTYRSYPNTGAYIGTKDNQVWYLVPSLGSEIKPLGTVADYLAKAVADNF